MGLELTTDRHPPITSQTRYPLRQATIGVMVVLLQNYLYIDDRNENNRANKCVDLHSVSFELRSVSCTIQNSVK